LKKRHCGTDHILDYKQGRETDYQRKKNETGYLNGRYQTLEISVEAAHDNSIQKRKDENHQQLFQNLVAGEV